MAGKERNMQIETNKWLYRNRDFAEKLSQNVTEALTSSGEFFSKENLTEALTGAIQCMTPKNTGLSEKEIQELSSDPKKAEAVVSKLTHLICETSPSSLDKNGKTVYTTQEIVDAERNILIQAKEMAERSTGGQPFANAAGVRDAVNELDQITQIASNGKFVMQDEYKELFDSFLQPSFLQIANGPPGCGKSTLAQGLLYSITRDALESGRPKPKVYATAPSSKAAGGIVDDMKIVGKNCFDVLSSSKRDQDLGIDRKRVREVMENLPSIEGGKPLEKMFDDVANMNRGDILVLDEAGLAGAKEMSKLLTLANERSVRLFMLGDNLQIPPAMAGNGLDELLAKQTELGIKTTELEIVLRQRDAAEAQWTLDLRAGNPEHAGDPEKDMTLKALNGYTGRHYTGFDEKGKALYVDVKEGKAVPENAVPGLQFIDNVHEQLTADYIAFRKEYPNLSSVVMAATKEEADDLQQVMRSELLKNGLIFPIPEFEGKICVGDVMMLKDLAGLEISKKNEKGKFEAASPDDVTTGDQLEVVGYDEKTGLLSFKKGRSEFACDAKAFEAQSKYGLVLPLYEAQGASRDRAFMAVGEAGYMDKVHTGVAFSRHEQQMSAYVSTVAYPDGIVGFAKEAREFSTRKQLYSDNKTMAEVLKQEPRKTFQEALIDMVKIGSKTKANEASEKASKRDFGKGVSFKLKQKTR